MKLYKRVEREDNDAITFYGSNKWIDLKYTNPRNKSDTIRQYFRFHGNRYYLDKFMAVHNRIHNPNPSEYMKEFDGYLNDSFFSGVCIKIGNDGEAVKAFLFTC